MKKCGKGRSQLSLFADDMMFYLEDPQISIERLLEVTSKISYIAVYRINT